MRLAPTPASAGAALRRRRAASASAVPAEASAEAALLDELQAALLDQKLLRAVASHDASKPPPPPQRRRLELRPLRLKDRVVLGASALVGQQAFSSNHGYDEDAAEFVAKALAESWRSWRVEMADCTLTLTRNRRGVLACHRGPPVLIGRAPPAAAHDRAKARLLDVSEPVFRVLGITGADGKLKTSTAAKFTQCSTFVTLLDDALGDAFEAGRLQHDAPLSLVDLGCGNAALTFSAHALLAGKRGLAVTSVGVDSKAQAAERNSRLAAQLGWSQGLHFVQAHIADAPSLPALTRVDVVLALHACDTASDDALAAGVRWGAPLLLIAPCCHHALQAQLKSRDAAGSNPFPALTRHALLRERFGDELTDALRAAILRLLGYRVDVLEFCASEHTPRNLLLRCARTRARPPASAWEDYDALCAAWGVEPPLGVALAAELAAARARGTEA